VRSLGLMVLIPVLIAPCRLLAADDWRTWPTGERLKLSVGLYAPGMDTEATISQVNGLAGTPVDFEDDLGLESTQTALFASINLRLFERHELNFNYYNLDRSAVDTLAEPLVFNGVVFPAGTRTDTVFDLAVYEMSYSYSFLFDQTKNLRFGFGVSAQNLDFRIASTDFPLLSTDESFVVPLPTLNVGADYALTDNWLLGANFGYMNADIQISGDTVDATVLIADAGVRWKPLRNVGVGLNYSLFHLDGNYSNKSIDAQLDLDYAGPQLSLDVFF